MSNTVAGSNVRAGSGRAPYGAEIPPEAKLLLLCAGVSTGTATDLEIRSLAQSELDWEALGRMAHEHRVACAVYRRLSQTCAEQVPERVLKRLQFRYQANTALYLQLCNRLIQVLQLLHEHGIEAITLKGPALAVQAFTEPNVREFRDLDILVRRADAFRARELLEAAGYAAFPKLSDPQMRVFMRSECEFWFSCPVDEVPLEVHWDLREPVYAYPLDLEECWNHTDTCEIAGQRVKVLSLEHTLLMLSCHGAKHRWGRLKLVRDLAELLRTRPDLDWEELLNRAERLNGLRMLLLGLHLASNLLGAELPEPVRLRSEGDRSLNRLITDVTTVLLSDRHARRQAVSSTRLYLRMRERWQDRLRYCAGTLLTPTLEDWNSLTLPEPLFPLYYLVRPLRLLSRPLLTRLRPQATGSAPGAAPTRP